MKLMRKLLFAAGLMVLAHPAAATDLRYSLQSQAFGGFTPGLFAYEQQRQSLRAQRRAEQERAAREAAGTTGPNVNQQFANAIIAQLTSIVARDIAQRIATSATGDAGTIQSGDVAVTFVNSDGQLSLVITTPGGTTNVTLPTGG
jgi:hypothetical protein